ncbi:Type 2 DNA topoisomerase 6 subunit B [uncultured archaeon]|nr:Type 2 DNA topoisomerase 6 subunit B [uncultured archaeon]
MADKNDVSEEQLSKEFREYSVAEFFKRNRQMLGYSGKIRSLTTIVHEFVTNSLDACEEGEILPEILVELEEVAAAKREEVIASGDGGKALFEIPQEVLEADMYEFYSNGIMLQNKVDYSIKTERKGKESVKVIILKAPLPVGNTIIAKYATGHIKVSVEDNGTGVPKKNVGQAFGKLLAGTKFHKRKQKRGQQGIGAAYAVLFGSMTTGKPTHVKSGIGDGKVYECDLSIDVKTNDPVTTNEKEYAGKFRGVKVTCEFAEVGYNKSEYSVYEYLRRTALANPHAQLTLIEPTGNVVVFPRSIKEIPQKPKAALPHALGMNVSDLMDMISSTKARSLSGFFTTEFSRFSNDKVKELEALTKIDFKKTPSSLQWTEAEKLVQQFQKVKWIAPEVDTLVPIGEEQIKKSLTSLLKPEQLKVVERKARVFRGGIPFLVEAAVAFGGEAGSTLGQEGKGVEILRFANRTPLLFDAGNCAITEAVKTIDWNRYDLKDIDHQPVSIFVNFVSVYVPYTGAGKLAISSEEEIVVEIRNALMECAREVSIYIHSLQKLADQEERRSIFMRYIGEVVACLHDITGVSKEKLKDKLSKIAKDRTALLEAKDESEDELNSDEDLGDSAEE